MNLGKNRILVVDDERDIRELIADILGDYDYAVTTVHDAAAARSAVRLNQFDAILLDIWLPGTDGITLLKEWSDRGDFDTPVIMMSAHGTVQTAVEAVRLGAYDYLEKPVSAGRLEITVKNAVRVGTIKSGPTEASVANSQDLQLVGSSKIMRSLHQQIEVVSSVTSNVLIVGEPGSGKRTVARMIHDAQNADGSPFVVLDWLSVDDDDRTISELIAEANGGTLLIPDLHVYDGHRQNKLLGMINTRSELSEQADSRAMPRLIATVADSVYSAVENGQFRREILNRLGDMKVEVPALRHYSEDMPELVGYLTDRLSQTENLRYKQFSTAALNRLRNHTWSGNLSELITVLRQALVEGDNETIIDTDIEPLLTEPSIPQNHSVTHSDDEYYFELPFREARAQFERDYLLRNLRRFKSYTELAQMTGLHRTSLFRKLKEHGIEVTPGYVGSESKDTDQS